jgi:hypothetical protein
MISKITHERLDKLVPGSVLDLGAPAVHGVFQVGMRPDDWTDDMKKRLLVVVEPGLISINPKDGAPLQLENLFYEGTGPDRKLTARQLILGQPVAELALSRNNASGLWDLANPTEVNILCYYSLGKFINYTSIFALSRQKQNGVHRPN